MKPARGSDPTPHPPVPLPVEGRGTGVWTFASKSLPEGDATNSPAVHGRVLGRSRTSPEGTAELFPQVSFVVVNPVLLQQRDEFVLESHFGDALPDFENR